MSKEKNLSVAFIGPPATFADVAARSHFGSAAELTPMLSLENVFLAVFRENVNFGIALLENSFGETTRRTLDLIVEFGLKINADLVVLSACQTGLGKVTAGDDVIGLNRAFFYAGTHTLVSSLWRVSDISTAILIKAFYRQYVSHNKADSLRTAMLHVKHRYPHPGYWGAFTLVGDYY